MASHGIPRGSGVKPLSEQARSRELRKIRRYKTIVETINAEIREQHFTLEVLNLTSRLLTENPEYYTIWNHRRLVMKYQLSEDSVDHPSQQVKAGESQPARALVQLVANDLNFLIPLLRQYPKCYWIWEYRRWLLEETSRQLPAIDSYKFWQEELGLVGKMLSLDSRNFHGWGYRRMIIVALKDHPLEVGDSPKVVAEQELHYTTRMIESNLSNFSAWHSRSKLIPEILNERKADSGERRAFFEKELNLIQRALYTDPYDQSLWFYHQCLMDNLEPRAPIISIISDLTSEEILAYLGSEIEKILEMQDGAEDCKWIYQSLLQLSKLYKKLSHRWPAQEDQIRNWIVELQKVDAIRSGRWADLEKELQLNSSA